MPSSNLSAAMDRGPELSTMPFVGTVVAKTPEVCRRVIGWPHTLQIELDETIDSGTTAKSLGAWFSVERHYFVTVFDVPRGS
jgi:hypothetical protein